MIIEDMNHATSIAFLKTLFVGRIACTRGLQPYVTTFSFALEDEYLYSFAAAGQKIDWMRANPLVCVEADKVEAFDDWTTVVIFGKYEELVDTMQFREKRDSAHRLLAKNPSWWQPASVRTVGSELERTFEPVLYRISIDEITGRHATGGAEL